MGINPQPPLTVIGFAVLFIVEADQDQIGVTKFIMQLLVRLGVRFP